LSPCAKLVLDNFTPAAPTRFLAEMDSALHLLSFFPDISLTVDDYLRRKDESQDRLWPNVPLLPGVEKLVHHLKKHNVPMAVATGSLKRNYILKTSGEQLQSVFQHFDLEKNVVTGDPMPEDPDVSGRVANGKRGIRKGRGKPHPDIFLVAAKECLERNVGDVSTDVSADLAEEWIVERRKGLVFEDAVLGVVAGKRAGMSGEECIPALRLICSPPFAMQLFGLQFLNFALLRRARAFLRIRPSSRSRSSDRRNGGFLRTTNESRYYLECECSVNFPHLFPFSWRNGKLDRMSDRGKCKRKAHSIPITCSQTIVQRLEDSS
jgi:beta-phosphoglucomutase-like phosphatase (HAD superfamily)